MSGFWPNCCCGCSGAIFRIAADSSIVWSQNWDVRYPLSALTTQFCFRSVTDGTDVYVIGSRASTDATPDNAYNVMKLDGDDGTVLWTVDLGAEAMDIAYVAGSGIVVSHLARMPVANSAVYTTNFNVGAGTVTLMTEFGATGSLTRSSSAATVQAALEALSGLSGKVTVSGTDFTSGLTVTFDSSIGNAAGLCMMPYMRLNDFGTIYMTPISVAVSGMENVTCLDPSDGSENWSTFVGPATDNHYFAGCVAPTGSDALITHRDDGSNNADVLDNSGSSTGTLRLPNYIGNIRYPQSVICDGTDYYVANIISGGNRVTKYNASLVQQWSATSAMAPIIFDGTYVWAKKVGTDFSQIDASSGSVTGTVVSLGSSAGLVTPWSSSGDLGAAICEMTDGGYMTNGHTPGTDTLADKYDASFAAVDSTICGGVVGKHALEFGDDCIVCGFQR